MEQHNEQIELFGDTPDANGSRRLARDGAELAYRNADDQWKADAVDVMYWCALNNRRFTSDQFWIECAYREIEAPRERRAFSAVVTDSVGKGWIALTGDYRPATRRQAHSRPVRVYESLIFAGVQS